MKDLISFLAIWFDNFKKHTFKVDVGLREQLSSYNKDLSKLEADLQKIIKSVSRLEEKDVTSELKEILEKIAAKEIAFPKIEIPKTVEVSNFPKQAEFPKSVEVSNFPEFPAPATDVTVSNFPPPQEIPEVVFPKVQEVKGDVTVKNPVSLTEVIKGLQVVVDAINDLKLELPKGMASVVSTSVSSPSKSLEYGTNDVDTTSEVGVVYLGEESPLGAWIVTKIDTSSISMVYATVSNNSVYTSYSSAWAARLFLTYDLFSIAK